VQAELGEQFGVPQPTISRAVTALTPMLGKMLNDYVSVAEDLDPRTQYIVDGTLLPCWSWHDQRQLNSGKRSTTGMNVQVVCDLHSRLAWISDAVDGCRHDIAALRISGVLDTLDPSIWMGDKGYVGGGMLTPIRKPEHRKLLDGEKALNRQVNRIGYMIERTIAQLKTWRILHTNYRRPLSTFTTAISTVIALHFYKIDCESPSDLDHHELAILAAYSPLLASGDRVAQVVVVVGVVTPTIRGRLNIRNNPLSLLGKKIDVERPEHLVACDCYRNIRFVSDPVVVLCRVVDNDDPFAKDANRIRGDHCGRLGPLAATECIKPFHVSSINRAKPRKVQNILSLFPTSPRM